MGTIIINTKTARPGWCYIVILYMQMQNFIPEVLIRPKASYGI